MTKMVSISGIVAYVRSTKATAEFYEKLGFLFDKREPDHLSVRLNWFWIDFHPEDKEDKPEFQQEAVATPKGAGQFLYIKVDNVDEFYKSLVEKGLTPSGQPMDYPWGNREFLIRDPDGYRLIFFQKR